ncbi:hypothetical protein GH733_015205, partial [Mirounga leonina]
MGLREKEKGCVDDIVYILKGHISDRYQFNSTKPIIPGHSNYIDYPLLKDRIHCVAFVFDINSVEYLSCDMMQRSKKFKGSVAHVVLLTHVDRMDLITRGDLRDIYRCMPVKLKLETVHRELGFALSNILVTLWAADDFLEDLPLEKTGRCIWWYRDLKVSCMAIPAWIYW